MSVKHFILAVVGVVVLTIGIGLFCKSHFRDIGISGIRTLSDVKALDCQVGFVIDDEFVEGSLKNFSYENFDQAPIALIVSPTNKLRQYNQMNVQEVTVIKSIKGDVPEQSTIRVIHMGGVVHYDFGENKNNFTPIFADVMNLMQARNEYLIFLTPYDLNEYTGEADYDIVCMGAFNYFNLTTDGNGVVAKGTTGISCLADFEGAEFLTDTKEHYDTLLEMKHKVIERYLGER
ncbi:hypothetical protein FACS1894111_09070 [Clostridia bacterium]|nr:hypothetical protein FACS1894111_09070 [Clostridia bacterium]